MAEQTLGENIENHAPTQRPGEAIDGNVPDDSCGGCAALAARVERLERDLADLALGGIPFPATTALGSTGCYWLTIAIHCVLFAVSAVGIQVLGILIYPFLMGSLGSLAVCHVLANRSVLHKFARTILSCACVCSVATVASGSSAGSMKELLQAELLYIPPMFVSAWFAAKILVWTRHWLIIPPGNDGRKMPLKIGDMLLVTLVVAVYFGVARVTIDADTLSFGTGEVLALFAFVALAVAFSSLAASLIARGVLARTIRIAWLVGAYFTCATGMSLVVAGYFLLSGEEIDFSTMHIYVLYFGFCALLSVLSPMITFLLMRTARYRFSSRSVKAKLIAERPAAPFIP